MFLLICFCVLNLTPIFTDALNIIHISSEVERYKDDEWIVKSGSKLDLRCIGEEVFWNLRNDSLSQPKIEIKTPGLTSLTIDNVTAGDTGYIKCGEHKSKAEKSVYIYVKDNKELMVPTPDLIFINAVEHSNVTIPCKPTSPNVKIDLINIGDDENVKDVGFDPHVGFLKPFIRIVDSGEYKCLAYDAFNSQTIHFSLIIDPHTDYISTPEITNSLGMKPVTIGSSLDLTCSVPNPHLGARISISWVLPNGEIVNDHRNNHGILFPPADPPFSIIPLKNVTKKNAGIYTCNVSDHNANSEFTKYTLKVVDEVMNYLNVSFKNKLANETNGIKLISPSKPSYSISVSIDCYPPYKRIKWLKDDKEIEESVKHSIKNTHRDSTLKITNLISEDSGVYSFFISNGEEKTLNITLLVEGVPYVQLHRLHNNQKYFKIGETHEVSCDFLPYDSNITWYYHICDEYPECENNTEHQIYESSEVRIQGVQTNSLIKIKATNSLILTCKVCNIYGCVNDSIEFLVSEFDDGFGITGPNTVVTGDVVNLTCGVTIYETNKYMEWRSVINHTLSNDTGISIINNETKYSNTLTLMLNPAKESMSGYFTCAYYNEDDDIFLKDFHLNVTAEKKPNVVVSFNKEEAKLPGEKLVWTCLASGNPPPTIIWKKNNKEIVIENEKSKNMSNSRIRFRERHSILEIIKVKEDDSGEYHCEAKNRVGTYVSFKVKLQVTSALAKYIIYVFVLILIVCILIILFLIVKIIQERRYKKELLKIGMEKFEEGAVESINPDLDVSEQADLLPYNKKFEFPRSKLKLGKQLGSGAFGVVLQAEADGIIEPDVKTTVAVKMVKQNVELSHMKALASELKIMIHLGRHLNVVNLLGACTRNLTNRELLVIVEYCPYGNLHRFLLKHRDSFINQVNPMTGKIDTTIISSTSKSVPPKYVNLPGRTQSVTGGSETAGYDSAQINSAGTDVTTISATTPIGEDGYLICREPPPEWNKNKTSEDGKTVSTQDLLGWSFQIARGMEYLASRKVLHGDLAARNILLAENNVVKICDFGLSKNMYEYKNSNYVKKGKRLLPVKWMALEAIRDRNFSIQSDVWAYGIVLWELFSLAQTPYPGLEDVERLYFKLDSGYRMEMPRYATKNLYEVMLNCWEERPSNRPSFTELAEKMGSMLEDSVKKHYVDLNDPYLADNAEYLSQRDYLSMLHSPNYANLDRENGESASRIVNGYMPMKKKESDAQEETELKPMLNSASSINGSSSELNPASNFVSVTDAASCSFSNPTYLNLDRAPVNPYTNTTFAN